jgi:hypothetical protein
MAFEVKRDFKLPAKVNTQLLVFDPRIEISGKADVLLNPLGIQETWDVKKGFAGFTLALRAKFDGVADFKMDRNSLAVKFGGVPLQPEVKFELDKVLEAPYSPLSVKFPIGSLLDETVDLGTYDPALTGTKVKFTVAVKLKVVIGPGPGLIATMGRGAAAGLAASGIVGGSIVGGIALTGASMYLIDRDHKRGLDWAAAVNVRSGYTWRIVAEALEWSPNGMPLSNRSWNEVKGRVESFRTVGLDTYAAAYAGWVRAEEALKATDPIVREKVLRRLHGYSRDLDALYRKISESVGVTASHSDPPPSNLNDFPR